MNEQVTTVDKKVYAYSIKAEQGIGEIFEKIKVKINNDYKNLEQRDLVFTDKKDGYKFFLDVRSIKKYKKVSSKDELAIYECILYKLRENDFPYLFDLATGIKSGISAADTEALMEQTHFLLVPEVNLIISEYNHVGVQPTKLIFLVNKILGPIYSNKFEVKHLLNSKTAVRINNLETINEFQFKAGHQGLKTISNYFKVEPLDVIDRCFENSTDLEFEIIIRGKGKGNNKKNLDLKDINMFKRLCNLIYHSKNKKTLDIKTAKFKEAELNSKLPIDLFSEYLVETVKAIKLSNRSKYIDSEDMFTKLLIIYKENHFEISNHIAID